MAPFCLRHFNQERTNLSVQVMSRIWELDLPQNEKLIALAFADHADDDGLAYPKIPRIAWKSGYSERQTRAIVGRLRERGILEAVDGHAGGSGLATMYRVVPEKGARIAPFSTKKPEATRRKTLKPRAEKGAVQRQKRPRIHMEPSVTITEPSLARGARKKRSSDASRTQNRAEKRTFSNLQAAGFPVG
jgi:hypothetical protein